VNAERSTGFIFYAETLYFDKYIRHTLTELSVQLREDKWYCAWFQQDLATFHTAVESLAALKSVQKSKSAPLNAMKALGGRGGIAPTHSRTQH
jgi:primosomal protein N''